jgi:hypothetical protein
MHTTDSGAQDTCDSDLDKPSVLELRTEDDEHDVQGDDDRGAGDYDATDDITVTV